MQRPPALTDQWELDDELRDMRRLLRTLETAPLGEPPQHAVPFADGGIVSAPPPHVRSAAAQRREIAAVAPRARQRRTPFFAGMILTVGLLTLLAGGALLAWSFLEERPDLWRIGMPLTIGGQAILLVGLVLQLHSLWQSSRETSGTLNELDGQLRDLRHATNLLSTTRSSPSQSFYAHLAEGASPQLLLADLKGQLDLLATQLAKSA